MTWIPQPQYLINHIASNPSSFILASPDRCSRFPWLISRISFQATAWSRNIHASLRFNRSQVFLSLFSISRTDVNNKREKLSILSLTVEKAGLIISLGTKVVGTLHSYANLE
jgi:hypothetical protein